MNSLQNLASSPAGTPILADDILEFHAARLLLLFKVCGTAGRIDGLTKMAKLDFFVRYPQFFNEVRRHLGKPSDSIAPPGPVESSMVRFHYGPWDQRYYHVLAYLEAKGLITVRKDGAAYRFQLTDAGKTVAGKAERSPAFAGLVSHMKEVREVLGGKAGSTLKRLVYEVFGNEVTKRRMGEVIK